MPRQQCRLVGCDGAVITRIGAGAVTIEARVVVEETFSGNEYFWNINDVPQSPIVTSYNDAYLELESRIAASAVLASSRAKLGVREPFSLLLGYERGNISTDSYVGVRFRSDGANFYELRILPSCALEVYKREQLLFSQVAPMNENDCNDNIADGLSLNLDNNNVLTVALNDSLPIEINLGDFDFDYLDGYFELVAFRSTVKFYYMVIVTP